MLNSAKIKENLTVVEIAPKHPNILTTIRVIDVNSSATIINLNNLQAQAAAYNKTEDIMK